MTCNPWHVQSLQLLFTTLHVINWIWNETPPSSGFLTSSLIVKEELEWQGQNHCPVHKEDSPAVFPFAASRVTRWPQTVRYFTSPAHLSTRYSWGCLWVKERRREAHFPLIGRESWIKWAKCGEKNNECIKEGGGEGRKERNWMWKGDMYTAASHSAVFIKPFLCLISMALCIFPSGGDLQIFTISQSCHQLMEGQTQ